MKLLSILVASIWAVAAAAQGISIGFPPVGQDVSPGQQLTIQVIKNQFIQGTIEAGLVIGFVPCPEAQFPLGCSPDALGTILFNGPFNPELNGRSFNENFTVTIPPNAPTGNASLGFARFFLSGVGNNPNIGSANLTVNVV